MWKQALIAGEYGQKINEYIAKAKKIAPHPAN